MTENKETEPPKRSLKPSFWMVFLILLLLALALFGDKGVVHTLKVSRYKAHIEKSLSELRSENKALRSEIEALRNDYRRVERIARQELGMVKEGELVYQFPPAQEPPLVQPDSSAPRENQAELKTSAAEN